MESIVTVFFSILAIYITIGFVFSVAFLTMGIGLIDSDARGTGLRFKVMVLPATVLFWPYLLMKWIGASKKKS